MKQQKEYAYIVLGDIGRSPRMCNHINEQLKDKSSNITLFCYKNKDVQPELENKRVSIYNFSMRLLIIAKMFPTFLYFALRIYFEIIQLVLFLIQNRQKKFEFIMLQNPPCFYLLWILQIYKSLTGCQIFVDIHNYGYTLMRTKHNWVLNLVKFLEFFWIRLVSDLVIVVSKGMEQDLQRKWKFKKILVLYDQINNDKFKPLTLREKDNYLSQYNEFSQQDGTIITQIKDSKIIERQNRPLILISNSSYSIDDDFDILYKACQMYENDQDVDRKIVLIFTGTGDLKKYWFNKFDELQSDKIQIYFKWFDHVDYPQICAIADFGLCLHNSSSGVDLPIKILDMFACKVPVIAYDYSSTLHELVQKGKNGVTFKNAEQLKQEIKEAAKGKKLQLKFNERTWEQEYKKFRQQINAMNKNKLKEE